MLELSDEKLGALLLERRLLGLEQVNECFGIQQKMRDLGIVPKAMREIILEKGFLTAPQLDSVSRPMGATTSSGPAATVVSTESTGMRAKGEVIQIPGYSIIAKLGQGGMGAVFKARQVSMDRLVAIKILPPRFAKDPTFVDRFYREAKASAKLNHENVIQGIDVGEVKDRGLHYFVMEFVEGYPVSKKLKDHNKLPEAEALDVGWQMTKALDHAHKNKLVHRDVKPENIMVTQDGIAKLCDLGLAKDIKSDSSLTQAGTSVGTPHYIAPEQARGERDVDIRADIYALGASLYHMLTGEVPFDGPTATVVMTKHVTDELVPPIKRNPELSAGANAIVVKAMLKQREQRYQTPAEMQEDLEAVRRGDPPLHAKVRGRPTSMAKPSPSSASLRAVRSGAAPYRAPGGGGTPVMLIAGGLALAAGLGGYVIASRNPSMGPGNGGSAGNRPVPVVANVPTPVNGVVPANTDPVAVRGPDHRAAEAALDAIGEFERECLAETRDYSEVRLRYQEFIEERKNGDVAKRAQIQLERFEEAVETRAEEWTAGVERKIREAMDAGRYQEADDLANDVPPALRSAYAVKRLAEASVGAKEAQEKAYRAATDECDAKVAGEDYAAAIAALDRISGFGDAGMKKTALEKRSALEDKRRAVDADRAKNSEKLYRDKYGPEIEKMLESRKLSQYPAALQRCRELIAGDLKWQAMNLEREYLIDATLLAAVRDDVLAGVNALHLRSLGITLEGVKLKEAVKFYPGTTTDWEFQGSTPVKVALNLDALTPADIHKLVVESPAYKTGGPDMWLKLGLLEWYSLHSADAEKWLKRAQKEYTDAKNFDRAARAKWFLDRVGELAAASQKEGEVQERFKKGEKAFTAKKWQEARDTLAPLLDPTHPAGYASMTWVKDRSPQIRDMIARCDQELAGKQAVAGVFAVEPKIGADGKWTLEYDFKDPGAAADWTAYGTGKWYPTTVGGKSMTLDGGNALWKGKLAGDFSFEIDFAPPPTGIKNFNVMFHANGLGMPRDSRFYLVELGAEVSTLDGIPQLAQQMRNLGTDRIVRLDATQGWQNIFKALDNKKVVAFGRGRNLVKLDRVKNQITVSVNNKVILRDQNDEIHSGNLTFGFVQSLAQVGRIKIVGTIDPEWLASQPGR